ncbi:MAG: zinc ribbon domain-containing protein [Chloroflexi bacterium]|uniref:Zinc ribbon domain-containing protein n=1 Tax=Candidatus Chlorohelix allophototropha TaxID=3003348 RepID=A0A8T7M8M9_9CHLR|nr:zinc ribbon domain-containing protein [Chloroflexota bacterium]WJW68402.1 zinc ribbon domain-containing protein [Chloroflexota bacterium L227-S17]
MPIYEYRCRVCNSKSNLFFRSIAAAPENSENTDLACPKCGNKALSRIFSRFAVRRGSSDEGDGFYEIDRMLANVDESDPQSLARVARKIAQQTGEDIGPEFDEAMSRIESGEDPDSVIEGYDKSAGEDSSIA